MNEAKDPNDANSAVDDAMSQMPGLKEAMGEKKAAPAGEDYLGEGGEDRDISVAAERAPVEDSEAVSSALNQIPGLREQMGR